MDKITKINLLFDYYGDFLTEKQKEIFELYYCYDLSFGEIAEQYGITRQGVYDIVHRSLRTLKDYEKNEVPVSRRCAKKLRERLEF